MNADLRVLATLADVPDADLTDEHVRWEIYQRVLVQPEARRHLRAVLPTEPVPSLASSVVIELFNHIPPTDRAAWLEVLPASTRPFATQRLADLELLESHQDLEVFDPAPHTPWLQRQLAANSINPTLLTVLATTGTTRRIRALARVRLQDLTKH
ncbi:hypothetical protein E0H73_32940 [Kribbella pittospori]|uniref:Uncharacterized protein n=1 Tax=Kribbella pittospori TaxID=722689 RepID=A0A4R0KDM4_9ACTN|nr:hypothetical protein [Kribbella pittospori]TCC56486.1 hypothetical protein E0H73_32940 [Kribbella pittospori]